MQDIAIKVNHVTKIYKLYANPQDRLKEFFHPLRKKYHHEFYALKDISFTIKKGEVVGIIGKNGSGKSTTLKIITGVLTPTKGTVEVYGKIASLLELGTGFNPELTGIENIYFNGSFMGYTRNEMHDKVEAILSFADIGEYIHQPVKTYSSGMFARLAFSVAINVEPDILIVDEALSVGDAKFQLKCMKKMQEIRDMGTTILYVSHDTYSVRTLCTQAIWLKDGEIASQGTTSDVVNHYLSYLDMNTEQTTATSDITHEDLRLSTVGETRISTQCEGEVSVAFKVTNTSEKPIDITYVFNLYSLRDQQYLCGATTLMDQKRYDTIPPESSKIVTLTFHHMNLLSGNYRLRVAVNDATGIGIYCDLKEAFIINIQDNHEAEGLMTLKRSWEITDETA